VHPLRIPAWVKTKTKRKKKDKSLRNLLTMMNANVRRWRGLSLLPLSTKPWSAVLRNLQDPRTHLENLLTIQVWLPIHSRNFSVVTHSRKNYKVHCSLRRISPLRIAKKVPQEISTLLQLDRSGLRPVTPYCLSSAQKPSSSRFLSAKSPNLSTVFKRTPLNWTK